MPEPKRPLKVFLCHASVDKPKVRDLYRYLKRRGIQPWLDEEDLVGGQDWQVEIPKALATSDAIIICLTKNSIDKEGYVQNEIKFALDKALGMPEGRIFLIPVKFEECEVPYTLNRYQWVDLTIESGYAKMMKALKFRASQLERSTVDLSKITVEDNLTREKIERESAEKTLREKEERVSAEKVASEKAEREVAEKALREKEEREAIEKAAREKAGREAAEKTLREKEDREVAEKAARERAEREAAEKTFRDKEEHKAARKALMAKAINVLKPVFSNRQGIFRVLVLIGIIVILYWAGSWAISALTEGIAAGDVTETLPPLLNTVITNTSTPVPLPTNTELPPPPTHPKELTLENAPALQKVSRLGKGQFNAVDWSSDGEFFAIASSIGFYLFESSTGNELLFVETNSNVETIALSMENNLVAIATSDKNSEVSIWNLGSLSVVQTVSMNKHANMVDFGPGGSVLVTAWQTEEEGSSYSGEVYLWDTATGEQLNVFPVATNSLSFSSDGRYLVTGGVGNDNRVYVWDLQKGEVQNSIVTSGYYYFSIEDVHFHPYQQKITWIETVREKLPDPDDCGCKFAYIDYRRFYDLDAGSVYLAATGYPMIYNSTGDQIASVTWDWVSDDTTIHLQQERDLSEVKKFVIEGPVLDYMTGNDDRSIRFLSFGGDLNELNLSSIDIASGDITLVGGLGLKERGLERITFLPEDKLVTLDSDGIISVLSKQTGDLQHSFLGDYLAILPFDKNILITGLNSGEIEFWDVTTWAKNTISERQNGQASPLSVNASGTILAASGYTTLEAKTGNIIGGKTILWDIETGEAGHTIRHDGVVTDLVFSQDEQHLLGASQTPDETIYDWDPATGKIQGRMNYQVPGFTKEPVVAEMALSSDDHTLAVGFSEEPLWDWRQAEFIYRATGPVEIQIWDLLTYSLVETLPGHSGSIQALEFSPDGRMLASGSVDGTIKIWDTATLDVLVTLSGHGGAVTDLLFDPDGFLLYSISQDGTTIVWGIP